MNQRVGIGYDIHRLIKGRKLFLGGVKIPHASGLLGHSDADALLHAVCDALLGAAGAGDIGEHFPDTDGRYKDISSIALLQAVGRIIKAKGYRINNIDSIVILEEPKLKNYKRAMEQAISAALGIKESRVAVKAKTNEGCGEIGEKKAIACHAVATLTKRVSR
jgi:2-C-methyl-D-erythritol 2,4-cyclodiphosphate synthase